MPTFVAWSEYENPLMYLHCTELIYWLSAAKRRSPPVVWLRGHNHISTIARAMLAFIADPR